MLNDIKQKIENLKNKKIEIQVDVGRNKKEVYKGVIVGTYKNVWTFETGGEIKSFSYSDILIKNVMISS